MKIIYVNHPKGEKPQIQLTVTRVEPKVWRELGFYKHHYLSAKLNPSAKCFLFKWGDIPVGFVAIINQPHKGCRWGYRITRLVVSPSVQGLGISTKILNWCGALITGSNPDATLGIMTIHEKLGRYFEKSYLWVPTSPNKRVRKNPEIEGNRYKNRMIRPSYCYKYAGEPITGYDELLLPINSLRDKKTPRQ